MIDWVVIYKKKYALNKKKLLSIVCFIKILYFCRIKIDYKTFIATYYIVFDATISLIILNRKQYYEKNYIPILLFLMYQKLYAKY